MFNVLLPRGTARFDQTPRLHSAWTFGLVALLAACGGRSDLNDYANGIPSVVPLTNPNSGSGIDAGASGNTPGNTSPDASSSNSDDGGNGGGNTGGGALGEACDPKTDPCAGSKSFCLQNVSILGGLVMISYPGGYCTLPGCASDKDCPDGSACFNGGSMPACLQTCQKTSECRADEGYTCGMVPLPGTTDQHSYCLPPTMGLGGG
jgi:hypothetical protein